MKLKSTVTLVAAFSLCLQLNACKSNSDSLIIEDSQAVVEVENTQRSEAESESKDIFVYICGAVNVPGVYCLQEGARVCDLIPMAGGFLPEAKEDYYNQAQVLQDGEKIYIPTQEEYEQVSNRDLSEPSPMRAEKDGKININLADEERLQQIPGIGKTKVDAIVAYREKNGLFESIDEIVKVNGIGSATFESMKEYITIS